MNNPTNNLAYQVIPYSFEKLLDILANNSFADIPLLGIDILREATTGNLYVIEVNDI